jgi:flagellar biogenesis protein FliO
MLKNHPMASNIYPIDWVAFAGNFFIVLISIIILFLCLRYLRTLPIMHHLVPPHKRLKIVETLGISSRNKVILLQYDDREILLGVSPSGLVCIAESKKQQMATSATEIPHEMGLSQTIPNQGKSTWLDKVLKM